MDLTAAIRTIPDYPKPGILFRDVTTLMADGAAFAYALDALAERFAEARATHVAGIEARGFIFGAALAPRLGAGFVPIRKKGKLPHHVHQASYALEYGEDTLEVHKDALTPNDRVLLIDDLLATGGTAGAALDLIGILGANCVGTGFVVELPALSGREKIESRGVGVEALVAFDGH